MRLEGKRALVTGSSRGIGQAIALAFAREGADVVINYIGNSDGALQTCAEIEKIGRRAVPIQADVSVPAETQKLIDGSIGALGSLDILVNNAGIEKRASFLEITEKDYRAVIDVDLTGPLFLSQAFVRHLRQTNRPGKIINISSVHEELPFPHFTPYCMAKGGLKMMMRNLAVELGDCGITVNNIAPGAIETPINRKLLNDPKELAALKSNIPMRRLGKTCDVSGAAVFLASADADYVTGATVVVDGGLLWNYSEQ
jgi:glucose 1-dehydrogenase